MLRRGTTLALLALALAAVDAQAGSRASIAVGAVVVTGGSCRFAPSSGDASGATEIPFSCTRGTAQAKTVRYAAAAAPARDAQRSLTVSRVREPASGASPASVLVTVTP